MKRLGLPYRRRGDKLVKDGMLVIKDSKRDVIECNMYHPAHDIRVAWRFR